MASTVSLQVVHEAIKTESVITDNQAAGRSEESLSLFYSQLVECLPDNQAQLRSSSCYVCSTVLYILHLQHKDNSKWT